MKKTLYILLSIIMVVLLAGCGTNSTVNETEKPKSDLISIDISKGNPNTNLIAFNSNEKYLVYIYDSFTLTESDPENIQGEGENDSENALQDSKTSPFTK